MYVQFYNNWCHAASANPFWDSLHQWLGYSEKTNGPKIFIGVPAERRGANIGYISPEKLKGVIYCYFVPFSYFSVKTASFIVNQRIANEDISCSDVIPKVYQMDV